MDQKELVSFVTGVNAALATIGIALRKSGVVETEPIARAIRKAMRSCPENFSQEHYCAPLDSLLAGITGTGSKSAEVIELFPKTSIAEAPASESEPQ
jgi:hypothetical protein